MAVEAPLYRIPGLTAGADLSGKQYHFVKLSGTGMGVVVCAAATDIPIGVLQNKPTSGQEAEVVALGLTKIVGDANLAIGDQIGTSADGQADAKTVGTDTTEYVVGRVVVENSAAGGLVSAVINCMNPHRAA